MAYRWLLLLLVASCLAAVFQTEAAESAPEISAERIKAAVTYLASDRLEGRGPGTRGEMLAVEYLADEFKKAGLKPTGERGTYYQQAEKKLNTVAIPRLELGQQGCPLFCERALRMTFRRWMASCWSCGSCACR